MKTLLLLLATGLLAWQANGQKLSEKDVPVSVVHEFKTQFATATSPKWEKEADQYEVEFNWNKKQHSATFDAMGQFLELETEIPVAELPKAIRQSVVAAYAGYQITEAAKIEKAGVTSYEAEVGKGKQSFDLIYDANGQLLEKIAKEEKPQD